MKIKLANPNDYHELMALYNLFVGSDRYSRYDNDAFKVVINNPHNFVFVAEENDKLVGFATFSVRDVIRYPKPIAELDELFVLAEYRQHGVGKQLMDQVETTAKSHNCYRLFIE